MAGTSKKVVKSTTTKQRQTKIVGGPGKMNGTTGVKFSKTNQPPRTAKQAGQDKRKYARDLIKQLFDMKYKFTPISIANGAGKQLVDAFGKDVVNKSAGELMVRQQFIKAILKADTIAFTAIMNQAYGMPKQEVGLTDEEGNDIITRVGYGKKDS